MMMMIIIIIIVILVKRHTVVTSEALAAVGCVFLLNDLRNKNGLVFPQRRRAIEELRPVPLRQY